VPTLHEYSLKTLLFGLVFVLTVRFAAGAATGLLVGSVRDTEGNALAGASVTARDSRGTVVGHDRTAANGTFAIVPDGTAVELDVTCTYCRSEHVSAGANTNFAIVVLRYTALAGGVPSGGDLQALPYVRPADVLGLIPYALPAPSGNDVSDRGLQRGHGLILDGGAPVYDISTGESALIDFPGRYMQQIDAISADQAFRYGSYAGGGTFALDQLGDTTLLSGDSGEPSTLALEPRFGVLAPAAGLSDEDGFVQRRADLDVATPFAGGALRAGITEADSAATPGPFDAYRNIQIARVSYATESRNYISSLGATTAAWNETDGLANASETGGSDTSFSARLERPNGIDVAAGASFTAQTGYDETSTNAALLSGRVTTGTAYLEAHGDARAVGFFAGLGLSNVTQHDSFDSITKSGSELVLLPSLEVHANSGLFGLSAGLSNSLRAPTLLEVEAANSDALERGNLLDATLSYDDRARLRLEATVFQEYLQGASAQRTLGLGGSLVWQIAPRLSLRFWTLNDSQQLFTGPNAYLPPMTPAPLGRQVLWTTYQAPAGIRFDAILQRNVTNGSQLSLDGDVVVPLTARLNLVAGTSRPNGKRSYSAGLRLH
jgi:hypothetical protein